VNTCFTCNTGLVVFKGSTPTTCVAKCPEFYFNEGGTCEICPVADCAECATSISPGRLCRTCKYNGNLGFVSSDYNTCYETCPSGFGANIGEYTCYKCTVQNCKSVLITRCILRTIRYLQTM